MRDESDSEYEPEEETKRAKKAAQKVRKPPKVEYMVSSCSKDFCAKNGLGEAAMDKILKICQRSMESRGNEQERQNASNILQGLLDRYQIDRKDVENLARPAQDAELLNSSAEYRVFYDDGRSIKGAWIWNTVESCCLLFSSGNYKYDGDAVFYGEHGNAKAASELFATLLPTMETMADTAAAEKETGKKRDARASFLVGISEGLYTTAFDLSKARKKYHEDNMQAASSAVEAIKSKIREQHAAGAAAVSDVEEKNSCPICLCALREKEADGTTKMVLTFGCTHEIHLSCAQTAVRANLTKCHICRAPVDYAQFMPEGAGAGITAAAAASAARAAEYAAMAAAYAEDESDEDDAWGSDGSISDPPSGASPSSAPAASDDDEGDCIIIGHFTGAQVQAMRNVAHISTAEEAAAELAREEQKHADSLKLALVDTRNAEIMRTVYDRVFPASMRNKDGALKAKFTRKSSKTRVRDNDAYDEGVQAAKRLKTCNALTQ